MATTEFPSKKEFWVEIIKLYGQNSYFWEAKQKEHSSEIKWF